MGVEQMNVYRGDDKVFDINVTDSEGEIVDITGYTVKFTVRAEANDDTYLIHKTTPSGSGISLIDPTNGVARLSLSSTDTDLTPGKYVYDVEVTDTNGRVSTVVVDTFKIIRDVTR